MFSTTGFGAAIDDESLCVVQVAGRTATGFAFLKPEWVVTAAHVVSDVDEAGGSIAAAFLGCETQEARILFRDSRVGLAVLEVEGTSPCQVPLFPSNARFTVGKGLVCYGYSPVLGHAGVARYTSAANPVRSFAWDEEDGATAEDRILFDAPWAEVGCSGGPLLGQGGSVVGVVVEVALLKGRPALRAASIHPLLHHLVFDPTDRPR